MADVRSRPLSRFAPHFSQQRLAPALQAAGIAYGFLGQELGGRPEGPACYVSGQLDYACLARQPGFAAGLQRLGAGARRHRTALLCAERDPAHCHRALLVTPALSARGLTVQHILASGELETQEALARRAGLSTMADLFPRE